MTRARPIFEVFPRLDVPFVALGDWPTPVDPLDRLVGAMGLGASAWVKRDDVSSAVYGGNKVRTLEVLFAEALEQRATHVYSTGAFGTNHGAATVLHAPRVGLVPGLVLFPQPRSKAAQQNFEVLVTHPGERTLLPHWSALPAGMLGASLRHRLRGERPFVMVPGGATPRGALGYVNAAFELAAQVREGAMPEPSAIFVGVGSTCTSAGLLVGLHLAQRLGLGLRAVPRVVAVRVTPWPVTAAFRIVGLAARTGALLAARSGDHRAAIDDKTLASTLDVDGAQLGAGYGKPTPEGREAIALFARYAGFALDTTYSGKAAAAMIAAMRRGARGPLLFWSTKSTAPLPRGGGVGERGWLARWFRG